MGFLFRKPFKIIPGVRLNVSKKGLSTNIGSRRLSVNIGKNGAYLNAGIPGTGILYREKIAGANNSQHYFNNIHSPVNPDAASVAKLLVYIVFVVLEMCFIGWIAESIFSKKDLVQQESVPAIVSPLIDPVALIPNIAFELKSVISDNVKNTALIEGALKCAGKPCPQTVWISLYAITAYSSSPTAKNFTFPVIEISQPFAGVKFQYLVKKGLPFDASGTDTQQSTNGLYVRAALSESDSNEAEQRLNVNAREIGRENKV